MRAAVACALAYVVVPGACKPVKGTPPIDAEVISIGQLVIMPSSLALRYGLDQPVQLTATATYSSGASLDVTPDVVWTSSDETVARVTAGLVKPTGAGTAMITAALGSASASVLATLEEPTVIVGSLGNDGLDFFDAFGSGSGAPLRSIRGSASTLGFNWDMVPRPASNELYVMNVDTPTAIDVFPLDGSGSDVAPLRQITGSATNLGTAAYGMKLYNDEIYVTTIDGAVNVYPREGSGNIAPTRTISGSNTGIAEPLGMEVHNGQIYVANETTGSIIVFSTTDSGNVAPTRTLGGSNTHLQFPTGIQFIGSDMIVTDDTGAVLVFPDDADGDVAPLRWIQGPNVGIAGAVESVVLRGMVLVTQFSNNSVMAVPLQGTGDVPAQTWYAGSATNIDSPRGIAIY